MKSTHSEGRRATDVQIYDNAAYLSFSFEASCTRKCDFGRNNRKTKYLDANTGLYPFVRLIEAGGRVYPEAGRFLAGVKCELERRNSEREHMRCRRLAPAGAISPQDLKSIDAFRGDGRYGGDGTRVDLAYAVYALSHGINTEEVDSAIRSRDLSHKGNERRQDDYVARTIKKPLTIIERGR